jgi:hypothetical protein
MFKGTSGRAGRFTCVMIAGVISGRMSFLTWLKMSRHVNVCKSNSRTLDANLERARDMYRRRADNGKD